MSIINISASCSTPKWYSPRHRRRVRLSEFRDSEDARLVGRGAVRGPELLEVVV